MEEGQKKIGDFVWQIPRCCVEGHDDCPHVPKKQRKKKINIAL